MKSYPYLTSILSFGLLTGLNAAQSGGRIVQISPGKGQFQLTVETSSAYAYQVQANTAVNNRFWADTGAPLAGTDGLTTTPVPGQAQVGFFRVLEFTDPVFWYDWRYYHQAPSLTDWGLGWNQNSYAHTDRSYEWYIDQADTGIYANNNCGPSSVTMAIKWYNRSFSKTAQDARATYPEGGGWWYTYDIINYLNLYSVPNTVTSFIGADQLTDILNQTNLIILCLNTAYLTRDSISEHRVGRFYAFAGGHFLVVKGYRMVDGQLFFEVYDPNNWHAAYADASPKGRNRHLQATDLANAVANWWNYLIVLPCPQSGNAGLRTATVKPVDPARIPHMWGL